MDDFVTYEQVGDAYSVLVMMGDGSLEYLDGLATNLLLDLDIGTSRMTAFTTNTGAVILQQRDQRLMEARIIDVCNIVNDHATKS